MRPALLLGAAAVALFAAGLLHAQQSRVDMARANAVAAERRATALERAAARERDQAAQARALEAAAASRVQAAQAELRAAEARIALVDGALRGQRVRLAERQGAIVNLVAALQSMARRPAVLTLAQPGSVADLVHVRAVLGSTLPVVQARSADVRAQLERNRRLRAQGVAAVRSLRDGRVRLEKERLALVQLEASHRLRSRDLGRSALFESDRALALGEQARGMVDQMQEQADAAETAQALAALPGPLPRPAQPGEAAPGPRDGPPPYRLPVAGTLVSGLGEVSDTGVRSRGLALVVAPGTPVVAPAHGQVLFAAKFRDYGRVVILDHGKGWTTLIAGLDKIAVRAGDMVGQGSALGVAAGGRPGQVIVELRRRDEPVDLTALIG